LHFHLPVTRVPTGHLPGNVFPGECARSTLAWRGGLPPPQTFRPRGFRSPSQKQIVELPKNKWTYQNAIQASQQSTGSSDNP